MIDVRMSSGHEGGDDDHGREERDERLRGERDAAIDELDLEHALPHPPEQQPLEPGPHGPDSPPQPTDGAVRGAVMAGGGRFIVSAAADASKPARRFARGEGTGRSGRSSGTLPTVVTQNV